MPFDGQITDFAPVAVPTVKPFDFDTASHDERLLELARMLDADQEWRDTLMEWDFTEVAVKTGCGTAGCALGLMGIVWPNFRNDGGGDGSFGMKREDYERIFLTGRATYGVRMEDVTPGHVATAIRHFVSNRGG